MDKPKPDRSKHLAWGPGDIQIISRPSDSEEEQPPEDQAADKSKADTDCIENSPDFA